MTAEKGESALRSEMRDKEWYLDVSEEMYEEMKAKGFDEESLFKPGRHTFRRRDASRIIKRDNEQNLIES